MPYYLKICFFAGLWMVSFFLVSTSASAQDREPVLAKTAGTTIQLSGTAYLDYSYLLASPIPDMEGENGFGYRRLYLTSDFALSGSFTGRARFEANDGSTTAQGRPAPFVKDLYLRWRRGNHDFYFGISSPPSFTVAEGVWGYRSLEKTIMDRTKILSSRDFGVTARGKLREDGSLRYGVMLANNSGVGGEDDKYKRVYGQLELYPSEALTFTLGGDFADYNDERDHVLNVNAFAGFENASFRAGIEGYLSQISLMDDAADASDEQFGISFFAAVPLNSTWEAVGRFDQVERDFAGVSTSESFFLAGVAYAPHEQVRFIPNLLVLSDSIEEDPLITGRVTLHIDF